MEKNAVAVFEQETHISFMRDEDFATVYTSDSTQITRLDKLCAASPEMYSLQRDDGRVKIYRIADKAMISLRAKKRQMTEEEKRIMAKRFKKG